MQCLACGAEMQLREVVLADIPTMPGFERHTFRCSACPQVARRLVICRAKMPVVDPLVPSAVSEAPTTNLQTGQQAAGVLPNAVEKLQAHRRLWRTRMLQTGCQRSRSSAWPSKSEQ